MSNLPILIQLKVSQLQAMAHHHQVQLVSCLFFALFSSSFLEVILLKETELYFRGSNILLTTTSDPPKPLQLYEFEACPFCRRVREAMTELDLSTEVYPCPKGSVRHREIVRKIGGKEQFPFLVDPNTGVSIYES
ncbi:THIOREDOXIN FAMILY PROTEIN, partial [Salix koriyanagi]